MPGSHASRGALRVVLDSNVWIDILVFDDPHTRPIRAALENGALAALIDARCLAELTYVLDYPQFVERNVDKSAALAVVTRLAQLCRARRAAGRTRGRCRNARTATIRNSSNSRTPPQARLAGFERSRGAETGEADRARFRVSDRTAGAVVCGFAK